MLLKRPRHLLSCAMLAAGVLLSGCGFHLRGTDVDSVTLEELQFSAPDEHSPTYRQLLAALQSDGVRITDTADYHLRLISDRHERVALSYTSRISAAEYEIRQHLTFQINDSEGRPLIGPETLTARRVYVNDRDNIVGTSEEEDLLREEMRRDMTRQVLFRLSSLTERDLAARERALDQLTP
ncbi:MAG: LPS assembly lipoprotein LptE [Pseudomonas profundi]|uniref:LPS-assembly lipoprotein LptE n=1 Tax=Pseudomonas profundi TaxID=1981513 RepID=UPI00300164B4